MQLSAMSRLQLTIIFGIINMLTASGSTANNTTNNNSNNSNNHNNNNNMQIIKFRNDNMDIDGYEFYYETSDGVSRQETATLKHAGTISVEGIVNWIGPDGVHYKLNYLADEHGFQPQGDHLPKQAATGMS